VTPSRTFSFSEAPVLHIRLEDMDILLFTAQIMNNLRLATAAGVCLGLTAMISGSTAESWMSFGHAITTGDRGHLVSVLEERKLPMRFTWVACHPNCRGWVAAVGVVMGDTVNEFDAFAREHELFGATIVLNSSGGSVNDAIALGRRWRDLEMLTTVGVSIEADGSGTYIAPQAYCESMCVFLLLSGTVRYVPNGAHVRVHQIWLGDRAHDAKAAIYSAHDLTIVERDIGRLAKYTFEMGGSGDLLLLSLSVPPWSDLYELSAIEMRSTNLVTAYSVLEVRLPNGGMTAAEGATVESMEYRVQREPMGSRRAVMSIKNTEGMPPVSGNPASSATHSIPPADRTTLSSPRGRMPSLEEK
jgi:hypothetical protein